MNHLLCFSWTSAFLYRTMCSDVEQPGMNRQSVQPMLLQKFVHLLLFCVIVVSAIHLFNKQFGMFWEIMNIDHKINHLLRNRLREIVYPINCNFWFVIYIFQFLPPLPEALLLSGTPRPETAKRAQDPRRSLEIMQLKWPIIKEIEKCRHTDSCTWGWWGETLCSGGSCLKRW